MDILNPTALFPRKAITGNNYSPINTIITLILLVSMFLAVLAKVAVKMVYLHSFGPDDAVLILALAFGAAQSAATTVQILHGVGRHFTSLSISQIAVYEKAGYTSALLYIMSLAISKISVLILLRQITPVISHRRLTLVVGAFVVIWSLSSFLASSFPCQMPRAWEIVGPHCFNQISFWESYAAFNLLTEIALLVLPVYTMWNVHIRMTQKLTVIACFAARILVVGAVIAQLILLSQLRDTIDVTFDTWSYQLASQFVMSLSVISVCIPYMRNVLMGFESGMFQTGTFRLDNLGTSKSTKQDNLPGTASTATAITASAPHGGSHTRGEFQIFAGTDVRDGAQPFGQVMSTAEATTPRDDWDQESQSSQAKIIKTTREWAVDYNGKDGGGA